ncbi:peroxisome assembly protein (Peroxin-2) [Malassezia cuniculi]|uniref:RING-type E3 ubiquitin transferase (cysteine targeting) n=1 Tax=Malassezia cuniculi TaxID=948313 RepID=A0AAF0J537_9BASI|nr:peroxisome assembly protein (Peroxin-2) [Malassezia cuniculi]
MTHDHRVPRFFEEAYARAAPQIANIRTQLPKFSSPPLRVHRVSQLDADLLDQELAELLAEPVRSALSAVRPNFETSMEPELYLALRLILFKFSVYDHAATYGAMLQNLRYRNEWAHQKGLQSTARDMPLAPIQLALYPLLTIVVPYAYKRTKMYMSKNAFADAPSDSQEYFIWNTLEHSMKAWNVLSLVNFCLFLWNGKYRTIADRVLGMRLTYASRALSRNVSFEFLNRQLVWNAFTEFLLFLLPLIKPNRLIRRLTRLPTHPVVLGSIYNALPQKLANRVGLIKGDDGVVALRTSARARPVQRGRYWKLPLECCALCFQRLEREAGVDVDVRPVEKKPRPRSKALSIPSANPLHPKKGLIARRKRRTEDAKRSMQSKEAQHDHGASDEAEAEAEAELELEAESEKPEHVERPSLLAASPNGIKYLDALANVPYATVPCADKGNGCTYCYYCIASQLLGENAEDDIQDGGWECIRCGERVTSAARVEMEDD